MPIVARAETRRKALPGYDGQTWGKRGVGQSIFEDSVTPKEKLGARLQLGVRVFYYCKAGEGLTKGNMTAFNVRVNHDDVPVTEHKLGTVKVTVLDDGTATSIDDFAEGMLLIHDGTGQGDQYVVKSNSAAIASANITVTLYGPGLITSWGSDTDMTLASSPFFNIKEHTDAVASGAGIPLIGISNAYFFWLQTYGPAAVHIMTSADSGATGGEQAMAIDANGDLVKAAAGDAISAISLLSGADTVEDNADFGYVFLTCVA